MKNVAAVIGSVVGGAIITGITGFINVTPQGLVGGVWYGWPTNWLSKLVIAPQYNPWRFHIASFLIDWVFWIVVVYLVERAISNRK